MLVSPQPLLRVFVVEDVRNMLAAFTHLLSEDQGFEIVGTANTNAGATQWLLDNEGRWDVISIDLVLDDGSGFDLIRRARAQVNAGRVVVFSAFATEVVREKCLRFGADAVFNKTEIREFSDFMYALRPSGRTGASSAQPSV